MNAKQLQELIKKTKRLTLLYVEDDEQIIETTLNILRRFFDNIIYAKDGEEGIIKFNENHIDIIISDINMPRKNGLDMLFDIKQIEPDIISLLTTAHEESVYYQGALDVNVQAYLVKPLKLDMFIEKLAKAIEIKTNHEADIVRMHYLRSANQYLIDMGYQIANESNYNKVLEIILATAKNISNADGGTIYIYNKEHRTLEFKVALNTSLNIHHGGTKGDHSINYDLDMFDEDRLLNTKNVAVVCASNDQLINISDIYLSNTYNFGGAKEFDKKYHYNTKSMLAIPMRDKNDNLVGVVQLINKKNDENRIISFNSDDEMLMYSLGAQATMMLNNHIKIDKMNSLFEELISSAKIDESISLEFKEKLKEISTL
jgi:YesN/AraC family two-component response regulator